MPPLPFDRNSGNLPAPPARLPESNEADVATVRLGRPGERRQTPSSTPCPSASASTSAGKRTRGKPTTRGSPLLLRQTKREGPVAGSPWCGGHGADQPDSLGQPGDRTRCLGPQSAEKKRNQAAAIAAPSAGGRTARARWRCRSKRKENTNFQKASAKPYGQNSTDDTETVDPAGGQQAVALVRASPPYWRGVWCR